MSNVSEARLQVWIYRELMGTLSNKKRSLMKKALEQKREESVLSPIEKRVWSAMMLYENRREQRQFIKQELKIWEQRTAP